MFVNLWVQNWEQNEFSNLSLFGSQSFNLFPKGSAVVRN